MDLALHNVKNLFVNLDLFAYLFVIQYTHSYIPTEMISKKTPTFLGGSKSHVSFIKLMAPIYSMLDYPRI